MTDHPKLLVLGYSESARFLRSAEAEQISAVIAIHGQREYPVDVSGIEHSIVLRFDDADVPDENDPLGAARMHQRRREAAAIGLTIDPPNESHAIAIIEFARRIRNIRGTLLCQCFAGISRSPAAALLCLAEWTGPGRERECVEQILAIRPAALPHRDLVRYGDRVLRRDGKLLAPLDELRP
jgi:predicted protein tyrosine phosphatase